MKFPKQTLINGARRAKRVALVGGAVTVGAIGGAVANTVVAALVAAEAVTELVVAPIAGAIAGGVAAGVAASTLLDDAPIEGEAVRC
ncbi:MAG: hypothetical protein MOGMAGMI_02649 [Candidatus Omnitrophica bacterium]|nr:hypothetical protein [Candidatus Omnitrophota bacterium]